MCDSVSCSGLLEWHALVNALLADFADLARLYYVISIDASSAALLVMVSASVMAAKFLAVPAAFALDRAHAPEKFAVPGCALAALAWTALAAVAGSRKLWTVTLFFAAECGIVLWSCALDATRVRTVLQSDAARAQQGRQLAAFFVGTALALLLGGGAATLMPPRAVFAVCAVACWCAAAGAPPLPSTCELQPDPEPVHAAVAKTLRAAAPYALLSNAVLAVPATTDAVVYFLAHTRGFTAMHMGLLGFATCVASAAAAVLAEKALARHGRGVVVVAGLVNCAAALALTTLASASESAERVPLLVRASAAGLGAAAQTAMCAPYAVVVAHELARRGERRGAVNACLQALGGLGGVAGVVFTAAMCGEFRVSAGDLSGVLPLLHVVAALTPLPMLVLR